MGITIIAFVIGFIFGIGLTSVFSIYLWLLLMGRGDVRIRDKTGKWIG